MHLFKRRVVVVASVAVAALALSGGVAFAVFPTDNVAHFTGCLNTSASPGGTFVNVAQGESPSKACGKGQIVAHLSGGDITNVKTAPGTGLTGGTDNGAASLTLDSTGCSSGGVLKWSGTSWACGDDNSDVYGAGTGLNLTGSIFSLQSSYQLPQSGCQSGQVVKSDGSGDWSCEADASGSLPNAWVAAMPNGDPVDITGNGADVVSLSLPAGSYSVVAKAVYSGSTSDETVGCDLVAGAQTIDHINLEYHAGDSWVPFSLVGVARLTGTGNASLHCGTGGLLGNVFYGRIAATEIGAINP